MATLRHIADAAGVSEATVSNVLNGRNKERWPSAKDRADRIRTIARDLDYRPNAAARATRLGRMRVVTLLLSPSAGTSHVSADLLRGITSALARSGYMLQIAPLDDSRLIDRGELPEFLRQHSSDGLIVNYTHRWPPKLDRLISRFELPGVWINAARSRNCVYADERKGSCLLTERLLASGCRRVAYFDLATAEEELDRAHFSVGDREAGYREAMEAAGRHPWVVRERRKTSNTHRHALIGEALAGPGRPDGIVTYSYPTPYVYAALQAGLKVPGDLRLATFRTAADVHQGVPIDLAVVSEEELGRRAAAMLIRDIETPVHRQRPDTLEYEILEAQP